MSVAVGAWRPVRVGEYVAWRHASSYAWSPDAPSYWLPGVVAALAARRVQVSSVDERGKTHLRWVPLHDVRPVVAGGGS